MDEEARRLLYVGLRRVRDLLIRALPEKTNCPPSSPLQWLQRQQPQAGAVSWKAEDYCSSQILISTADGLVVDMLR